MSEDANRAWKAQYMLRMPEDLRDRIKAASERNGRSMNVEIVRLLEREFPKPAMNVEEFLHYLGSSFTGTMTPDEQIWRQRNLNRMLEMLGINLEAHLQSGDLVLRPREPQPKNTEAE